MRFYQLNNFTSLASTSAETQNAALKKEEKKKKKKLTNKPNYFFWGLLVSPYRALACIFGGVI